MWFGGAGGEEGEEDEKDDRGMKRGPRDWDVGVHIYYPMCVLNECYPTTELDSLMTGGLLQSENVKVPVANAL